MYPFRPLRADIVVSCIFAVPLSGWRQLPERFYISFMKALGPKYPFSAAEFSVSNSQTLSELWAKISLFSGAGQITLFVDKIVFQFSGISSVDQETVLEVVKIGHDAFLQEFTEAGFSKIEYKTYEHLELIDNSPSEYFYDLAPLKINMIPEFDSGVFDSGLNIKFRSEDVSISIIGEKSLLSASAIFISLVIGSARLAEKSSFSEKYEYLTRIIALCSKALRLELTARSS